MVKSAKRENDSQEYALKIFKFDSSDDESYTMELFLDEVKAM